MQLKRRCDLVPSLVATVAGYARHERGTLTGVTAARQQAVAVAGQPPAQRGGRRVPSRRLSAGCSPWPRPTPSSRPTPASAPCTSRWSKSRTPSSTARRYYNAVVRDYNTMAHSFPTVLVAGPLGFSQREFFQLDSGAERGAGREAGVTVRAECAAA